MNTLNNSFENYFLQIMPSLSINSSFISIKQILYTSFSNYSQIMPTCKAFQAYFYALIMIDLIY